MANKIVPSLLDRVLAKQGYSGQITSEPLPPHACANLYDPCDTNPGAHGRFDSQAKSSSMQWWLTTHRPLALGCAVVVLAALVAFIDT